MSLKNQNKEQSTKETLGQSMTEIPTTTTTTTTYKLQRVGTYLVAIIIAIAAFLHIFFSPINTPIAQARKNHTLAKQEWRASDKKLKHLLFEFNEEKIDIHSFKAQLPSLIKEYKETEARSAALYKELNRVKKSKEILKFNDIRSLLFAISFPVILFVISIVLVLLSFSYRLTELKKSIRALGQTTLFISIFYLIWFFYPKEDLPYWTYIIILFISAASISVCINYLLKWQINVFDKKYNITRTRFLESALDLSVELLNKKKSKR